MILFTLGFAFGLDWIKMLGCTCKVHTAFCILYSRNSWHETFFASRPRFSLLLIGKIICFYYLKMHISNIPDLILAGIIRSFCQDVQHRIRHPADKEKWAEKFVLLAVCRKWRYFALPLVHKYSFISIDYAFSPMGNNSDSGAQSNLDMVLKSRDIIFPTHLYVTFDYYNSQLFILAALVDKLKAHADVLESISSVTITTPDISYYGHDEARVSVNSKQIVFFGNEFMRILPSVSILDWEDIPDDYFMADFAKILYIGYVSQLTQINYNLPLLTSVSSLSENLTHLRVDFSETQSMYLPRIPSKNLVSLELTGLTDGFDWSLFEDPNKYNTVYFASLQRIELDILSSSGLMDSRSKFKQIVIAPKLEFIKFPVCTFTLSFLARIGDLENVTLNIDIPGYAHCIIANTKLSYALINVFVNYIHNASSYNIPIDAALFTSDMLCIPALAGAVSLIYTAYRRPFTIQHSVLPSLHQLHLQTTTFLSDLVNILPKLPNLVELHAKHMCFTEYNDYDYSFSNDFDSCLPDISAYLHKKMLPGKLLISTSVKRIHLVIAAPSYPAHLKLDLHKFFHTRIPSLEDIVVR